MKQIHAQYSADSEVCMFAKLWHIKGIVVSGSKDRLVTSLECILHVSQQLTVYKDFSRMA